MPIKDYPFTTIIPRRGRLRPMLWVRIANPDTDSAIIAKAIVDTGADRCSFPAAVASRLGHNLESVSPKTIETAGGCARAFAHTSRIEILGIRPNGLPSGDVLFTINETPIDFIEGCESYLLGAEEFLVNFILTVDYPRKVFSIRNSVRK